MDNTLLNNELSICIEKIETLFLYDTITLLDCVLTDDISDPEYSANIAYNRLECVVNFDRLYSGKNVNSVEEYLLQNGYTNDDISDFAKRRACEQSRHEQMKREQIEH